MTLAVEAPEEQSFVLDGVSWDFYEHLLREVGDRRIFVTYNRGRLEIMSPSWKHERYGQLTSMVVRIVALELKIPFESGGSTTFRSKHTDGGLEPDQCFYIQHAAAVIGRDEIDLTVDPPPDLVIEIEMSRRLADRIEVYRGLRVPEIWLENGKRLQILRLAGSQYEPTDRSAAMPQLLPDQVHALVEASRTMDEGSWIRSVQEWTRENIRPTL